MDILMSFLEATREKQHIDRYLFTFHWANDYCCQIVMISPTIRSPTMTGTPSPNRPQQHSQQTPTTLSSLSLPSSSLLLLSSQDNIVNILRLEGVEKIQFVMQYAISLHTVSAPRQAPPSQAKPTDPTNDKTYRGSVCVFELSRGYICQM